MTKLKYFNEALGDKGQLVLVDYDILKELYKESFQTSKMIASTLEIDEDKVISSLTKMQDFGLVEISSDRFLTSPEADEAIENGARLWIEAEHPEKLEKKCGPNKRIITEQMTDLKEFALEYLEGKIDVKEAVVYRSNYFINFEKRMKGLGGLEIKNKPEIRVCIRKPSEETIQYFAGIGMTYRSATNQTYFDMEKTQENLVKLIDAIVKYFEI